MPRYAELIYNGFWFTPEREMLQALIDKSQEHVEGEVRLKLYKGNVMMAGRESRKSLYSSTLVTFEDDKGAYDQKDAEGFIRLNALRLPHARHAAGRNSRNKAPPFGCGGCAITHRLKGEPRHDSKATMRNLFGKIALTTGSALIAGGLLVIAYLSAGAFILAGILSAVFLVGETHRTWCNMSSPRSRFLPPSFSQRRSGVERARRRHLVDVEEKSGRQAAAALAHRHRFLPVFAEQRLLAVILALANSNAATSELDGPSQSSALIGSIVSTRALGSSGPPFTRHHPSSSRFPRP